MSSPKGQGDNPQQGGVIPDEAVEDLTDDAREAATSEAAEETAAGGRTPVPGEQADAEVPRKARRARRARRKAEGGDAEDGDAKDGDAADENGTDLETAEEPEAGEAQEGEASDRPRRSARRRAAETTTAAGARPSRRRDPEEVVSVRAQAKYVRCAPRKARLVIDHIRGKSVDDARAILLTTPRAASRDVLKLLDSCVANAENNHELSADELRVEKAYVDEGPTLKRYRPRALGRATRIRKRTSHMTIYLTNRGRR
jgi:large subunit ribosomal protein L22